MAVGVLRRRIYTFGGESQYTAYNSVEIYDTFTNTWSVGKPMLTACTSVQAVLVHGEFYIVGGFVDFSGGCITSVEIYDPIADS